MSSEKMPRSAEDEWIEYQLDDCAGTAQQMTNCPTAAFIYCECSLGMIAIIDSTDMKIIGIGCPECQYTLPFTSKQLSNVTKESISGNSQ